METDRILVIDIGNTTIAFTVLRQLQEEVPVTAREAVPPGSGEAKAETKADAEAEAEEKAEAKADAKAKAESAELDICFTAKLPTESGKDIPGFLAAARNLLRDFLPAEGTGHSAFSLAAVSSVVPACTPAATAFARKVCSAPPVIIGVRCDTGLRFDGMPEPQKIGADRIADAAWAAARYPLPAMTVDLGTATTINVVGKDGGSGGVFLGGMIGAGVRTSLRALRTGTAQLPALEPVEVPERKLIGRNTDECMLSAAVVGTAAMIEGIAARVEDQLGSSVTLVLTGGNAALAAPWIRRPFHYEPALAAKGAAAIALRELRSSEKRL